MDFQCITVPYEMFPRFRYACLKSFDFQTRYNVFKRKVSAGTLKPSQFVTVHLCKKRGETVFPISINDLFLNATEKNNLKTGELMELRNIRSYLKQQKEIFAASLLVVGCSAHQELAKCCSTRISAVVIANDDPTKEQLTKHFRGEKEINIIVTKKATIVSEVNTLLERCALAPLKQISEDCYSALQQECKNSAELTTASADMCLLPEKYRKVESEAGFVLASPSQCNGFVLPRKIKARKQANGIVHKTTQSSHCHILLPQTRSGGKKHEGPDEDILPEVSQNHSNKACDEDFYERLLEGILALYGMSNIPEEFRPDVPDQNYDFSKELRNELLEICPTIRRIGYRYRTFYVYAATSKRRIDRSVRDRKIESVLQRHGIKKFEIAPCADSFTEFSHVGANIEARSSATISLRTREISRVVKGGTLGCFVNVNKGKKQCGLLAKHVCKDCCEIYYIADGNNELLGDILPETNTQQYGSLDISAALMMKHVEDDQTKLIDTRGNRMKGILHEYNDSQPDVICRSGQSVHIYGATSSPGLGEITMPVVDLGLSSTLIQVEDQTGNDGEVESSFAQEGDSGAIVCVEDMNYDVHALSMVMGRSNLNPRDKKSTARRTYLTVPLSKGIQQLENDTGKKFTLC